MKVMVGSLHTLKQVNWTEINAVCKTNRNLYEPLVDITWNRFENSWHATVQCIISCVLDRFTEHRRVREWVKQRWILKQRQSFLLSNRFSTAVLMLQCCVCLSSVCRSVVIVCAECIVAKRCALKQKLLLTASYMRNPLVPKWMTLTFV